jgi:CarD family transcriptional regulator
MFKKGDLVLYGTNGLCDITDVTTVDIPGIDKDRLYYILSARSSKCTIYVAADGDLSKMRKPISKEEAKDLISKIGEIEPLKLKDEKKPDAEYKEVLQKYDCIELFKLIKCIYFRRKKRLDEGKKVTAADDKYMHLAEDVLYQELGVVLDIPKDQVLDYIIKELEGNSR